MSERLRPAPAFESWQGRVLRGKYRVGRKLGSGGWGAVYEAEHLVLGRKVAIKFLHPDVEDEPNARERFRREAIAASRTGHPNIVEVIDLDVLPDGREFIVLELLDGRELSSILAKEKSLSLSRALPIFTQIADALAAAHRADLVHRDLKPENVLLCRAPGGEEVVKILDFGVAKLRSLSARELDTFTGTGEVLGTPRYMAPEQVRGDPNLDHRADIHALGLIMYESLAGAGPFDSNDLPTFLTKLLHEVPVPLAVRLDDVPRALSDLVQRMLAKSAAERPKAAEEVYASLVAISENLMWSRYGHSANGIPTEGYVEDLTKPFDPSADVAVFMEKLEASSSSAVTSPKSPIPATSSQTVAIRQGARAPLQKAAPVEEPSSVIISIEYLEPGSLEADKSQTIPKAPRPREPEPARAREPERLPPPARVPASRPPEPRRPSGAPRPKRKRRRARRRSLALLVSQRSVSTELQRWRAAALVLLGVVLSGLAATIAWFVVQA